MDSAIVDFGNLFFPKAALLTPLFAMECKAFTDHLSSFLASGAGTILVFLLSISRCAAKQHFGGPVIVHRQPEGLPDPLLQAASELMKFRVLGFRGDEDRDVRVGVFP